MERRKNKLICLLFICMILSCVSNEDSDKEQNLSSYIINQVFYEILDSLDRYHNIKAKTIVHYPDLVRVQLLSLALEDLENDTSPKADLVRGLAKIAGEKIDYKINVNQDKQFKFIFDNDLVEQHLKLESSNSALLNVSKISFNDTKSNGCFYVDIQCGNECSGGYLVFIKVTKNDNWEIAGLIRIWS